MKRFQKVCIGCILFILCFIFAYANPLRCTLEGLHNIGTGEADDSELHAVRGAVPYNYMYKYLTLKDMNNPSHQFYVGQDISGKIQTPPYSHMDFTSNLDEDTVLKDFQYFNNASAITAGHSVFQNS